jgi:hypothetical protein
MIIVAVLHKKHTNLMLLQQESYKDVSAVTCLIKEMAGIQVQSHIYFYFYLLQDFPCSVFKLFTENHNLFYEDVAK